MGDANLEAGRTHQSGGFQSEATAIPRSEGLRSIPLTPGLINTKFCVCFSKPLNCKWPPPYSLSLSVYCHDHRLVRVLKNTLYFVYPYLLLSLKNISHVVRNNFPLAFRESGDVAPCQFPGDDAFNGHG